MATPAVFAISRPSPPPPPPLHSLTPRMASSASTTDRGGHEVRFQESPEFSSLNLEVVGARCSLLARFESLQKPYRPFPLIGWNRHVETIFSALFRSVPRLALRRECLRTKDGGTVSIDWVSGDEQELPADSPVLILLHGLTGGSHDAYVRHMLVRARDKGWRAVAFNGRSGANSPVTTPQFYSASFTEDIRQVINLVSTRYSKSNIFAIGWSLGANILVNYLGQESHSCPLSGAVSLCNPFDLVIADENFHKGFNNFYNGALARTMRENFKKHMLLFEGLGGEYNISMAANARTVREFDEALTRVCFGFKSVDDYYYNASCSRSIKHVSTPLLCIQAANDPFAPAEGIPREEIKENPHCLLIVTPQGGHLGWVAGDEAPFGCPWTDPVVMEFLEHANKEKVESSKSSHEDRGDGVLRSSQATSAHNY